MKRNKKSLALTISMLLFAVVLVLGVDSCKKKKSDPEPQVPVWNDPVSPDPQADGQLPVAVLPEELSDTISQYITINSGENPPLFSGEFVSSPHVLMAANYQTDVNDTIGSTYNDRYIAFFEHSGYMDFYGKQWDDEYHVDYEEVIRNLHILGMGENFTCYYLTEGYPNGLYACYSTIFSGKWNANYGGLKDFQVAVILTETSGNPYLAPKGSYRVLGDGNGLAENNNWLSGKSIEPNHEKMTDEDLFRMFRVK